MHAPAVEGVAEARRRRPRVCAVVVTFNPGETIARNVRALIGQVEEVIVIDNGSGGEAADRVRALGEIPGVRILVNGTNVGLASALNRGLAVAAEAGAEWVATFDQDSTAPADLVPRLLEAMEAADAPDRVAVVGPTYVDEGSGLTHSFAADRGSNALSVPVDVMLTSGSLVRLSAVDRIGGFEDGFFIDYIDIEFCLRCAARGYVVIAANQAKLLHNLGNATRHRFLGREIGVTHHAPGRRYYIARNRVAVYRRYALLRPGWVARDIYSFVREMVKVMLFESDRTRKLAATARGLLHGVLGRSGPHG